MTLVEIFAYKIMYTPSLREKVRSQALKVLRERGLGELESRLGDVMAVRMGMMRFCLR